MRVGIYIRVSTQEQANEGYSIGEQTERLKAYCTARNWNIYQVYTDAGMSGANIDRSALKQMQQDIINKKLDLVLVYKLDRLSRSQKDTLYLIEDVFLKNNVDFVSMNENFDTSTPFGRAMIGILSVFAQLEREQIKERTAMGREARAKAGYFHGGGFAPIGYDYVDGELIVNEYEAMQVKKVHELYHKGLPINRISNYMHKRYTTKHGGWEFHSTVRSALTQRIYTGVIEWKGEIYEGRHEAIIDNKTFEKTMKLFEQNTWEKGSGERKARPFQAKYLLTGLLHCENCGARYFAKGNYSGRGENRRYRPYYTCYSRAKTAKRFIIDPNCKNPTYAVEKLDAIIKDEIKKLSFNPEHIHDIQREQLGSEAAEQANHNEVIQKRIRDIDNQVERLLDLYQLDNIPFDTITERIGALNNEKKALTEELVNEKKHVPALTTSEAEELLKRAIGILDKGDLQEQRQLVHSLIDHIIITDDGIEIHWAFI